MTINIRDSRDIHQLESYFDTQLRKGKLIFKESAKELFTRIVADTPTHFVALPSSGNTRANWNVSEGMPDFTVNEGIDDYSGERTKAEISSFIQKTRVTDGLSLVLANATEAAAALEFGLYPRPEARVGSLVPGTNNEYEKRSKGGYSLQAPHGMVAVNILDWDSIIDEKVKKHSRSNMV